MYDNLINDCTNAPGFVTESTQLQANKTNPDNKTWGISAIIKLDMAKAFLTLLENKE